MSQREERKENLAWKTKGDAIANAMWLELAMERVHDGFSRNLTYIHFQNQRTYSYLCLLRMQNGTHTHWIFQISEFYSGI